MNPSYHFGRHELRPAQRLLLTDGQPVALGARAFDLLVYLLEHRERVVPKDEVLERVWPGLVVEENNLSVQVSALRKAIGTQAIATVPGQGYRFTMAMETPPAPVIDATVTAPDLPSIAVLPFQNLSGDPEQEFFADGMCEDIITLLSHVPSLVVIARNSTFSYKGRAVDVREVARELGVRYVLEGSVRRAGTRLRVSAQFVDALTGGQLWAERYDREVQDIFSLQDEVAQGIAGVLQSRLPAAEAQFASRKPPATVDAWGHVVQAKVKLHIYRREDVDAAEPHVRQAIAIDAAYGEAHAFLAHLMAWRSYNRWCDDWYAAAKESGRLCEQALALAPGDSAVLTDIGFAYWFLGRFAKSVPILERAATLNTSAAMTQALLGNALAIVGRCDEGLAHLRRAFLLSPRDPLEFMFHTMLATVEFFSSHYEASKQAADRALDISPNFVAALLMRAAACVRLSQHAQARALLARIDCLGSQWAVDNLFRPRTEGTLWDRYSGTIREVMDHEPRL